MCNDLIVKAPEDVGCKNLFPWFIRTMFRRQQCRQGHHHLFCNRIGQIRRFDCVWVTIIFHLDEVGGSLRTQGQQIDSLDSVELTGELISIKIRVVELFGHPPRWKGKRQRIDLHYDRHVHISRYRSDCLRLSSSAVTGPMSLRSFDWVSTTDCS